MRQSDSGRAAAVLEISTRFAAASTSRWRLRLPSVSPQSFLIAANGRPFGWARREVSTPRRARSCMTLSRPSYANGCARCSFDLALIAVPPISELQHAGHHEVADSEGYAHFPWRGGNVGPDR